VIVASLSRRDLLRLPEARELYRAGLKIVSCYQFGKGETADWLPGASAGVEHAKRGWQLHTAAGGPIGAPVYASIDDDPSYAQYRAQVAPYLRGWESVIGRVAHPAAHLHQVEIDARSVGGVDVESRTQTAIRAVGLTRGARLLPSKEASKHLLGWVAGLAASSVAEHNAASCGPRGRNQIITI